MRELLLVFVVCFFGLLAICCASSDTSEAVAGSDYYEESSYGRQGFQCEQGESRCQGQVVQTCDSGEWTDEIDCVSTGKICWVIQSMARCIHAGSGYGAGASDVEPDTDDLVDRDAGADAAPDSGG